MVDVASEVWIVRVITPARKESSRYFYVGKDTAAKALTAVRAHPSVERGTIVQIVRHLGISELRKLDPPIEVDEVRGGPTS
jgi:hypothetical protein